MKFDNLRTSIEKIQSIWKNLTYAYWNQKPFQKVQSCRVVMILKKKNLELVYFIVLVGFFFAVFWLFIFLKGTFWFVTLFSIFITVLIRSGYSNVFCKKAVTNIFCNICKKEPMLETFFTNVVGSVPVFLRKGDFWHSYFTLKFAKYFWTPFL